MELLLVRLRVVLVMVGPVGGQLRLERQQDPVLLLAQLFALLGRLAPVPMVVVVLCDLLRQLISHCAWLSLAQ